jgi:hypothetical protein
MRPTSCGHYVRGLLYPDRQRQKLHPASLAGVLSRERQGQASYHCQYLQSLTLEDSRALAEESKLDGCYVLKTDLRQQAVSKEVVQERYKDLALVEWAFRSSKTVHLEARPIYVRRESRTRGHVFVVMLAYLIIAELARRWQELDTTVEQGIKALSTICPTKVLVKGVVRCMQIPRPRETLQRLLGAAGINLPDALPSRGVVVTTKKKLPERRKNR